MKTPVSKYHSHLNAIVGISEQEDSFRPAQKNLNPEPLLKAVVGRV